MGYGLVDIYEVTGLNSEPTSYQLEWEVSAWVDWKLWVVEGS